MRRQRKLEQIVEGLLWNVRFLTIVPVFFGVVSVIVLFAVGTWEISQAVLEVFHFEADPEKYTIEIMRDIIGGIDLYLMGVVLIIFSFGIYELFISKIDIARGENQEIKILEITSLEQLKDKLLKVIIMVLVVGFFKRVMEIEIKQPIELLYFAMSILLIAASSYFLHSSSGAKHVSKSSHSSQEEH
ncbi:YqhA family protein [Limnofasciculus baicalensis]|uniref:YqhA family protein n=1 Tax=Limnofasciculus baicalensis BBK-W-15 TaxID=2699891 RepID=A0AAE3GX96_9CYAN|nr:YqhA family protein [Limnofasciculus baicalensis]MCP2731496.1 YqhA family protein [Limnofasciculus baicalensis BBK-W-15]